VCTPEKSFCKQSLYELGARKIAVAGVPPLGCVPMVRTTRGGITRECADIFNQASVLMNNELSAELTRLTHNLSGSQVAYIDIYNMLLDLIVNSDHYGIFFFFEKEMRA
jgi:phospholipase/lecithinase/hemolysin